MCAGRPPPPAAVPAGSVPLVPGTRGSSSILARGEQGEAGRTVGPGQSFQYRVVRTATSEAPRPLWLSGLVSEGGDGRLLSRGGGPHVHRLRRECGAGQGSWGWGDPRGGGPDAQPAPSWHAGCQRGRLPRLVRKPTSSGEARGVRGSRGGQDGSPPERWARGQGVGVGRWPGHRQPRQPSRPTEPRCREHILRLTPQPWARRLGRSARLLASRTSTVKGRWPPDQTGKSQAPDFGEAGRGRRASGLGSGGRSLSARPGGPQRPASSCCSVLSHSLSSRETLVP